ncbi:hypothetical protein H5410_045635 [Solanum commersonii]|uniref:GST C-terminal domain-containing protein n=1 Tax=Solanum commersonii TaxID=4109 RepID=A0A9J5XA27_SOLCO|nr:hypothetical protein H5410_045635 [Solanum commersonii]
MRHLMAIPSCLKILMTVRALARFWDKFLDDKVTAVVNTFFRKGDEQEKGKEEVYEMLKVLDNELKYKFFVGDKFGFADIVANMVALWLRIYEEASGVVLVTSQKNFKFCAWRDEYINCSQVKKYLPSRRDELLTFFHPRVRACAQVTTTTKKLIKNDGSKSDGRRRSKKLCH